MSLLALLAACTPKPSPPDLSASGPSGSPSGSELTDSASPGEETGLPCVPEVGALLFDLGETLVTEQGDLFVLRPDTLEMVVALKARGLPIGIVTNTLPSWTEEDLRALLADPELLDEFDIVLMSSEAEAPPKPDPAIFAEAHRLLQQAVPSTPPIERTAFVTEEADDLADQPSSPSEGARAAGLVGVLLSEAPSELADYTASSLAEIAGAPWLSCAR